MSAQERTPPVIKPASFLRDGFKVVTGTYAHVAMQIIVGILLVRVWGAEARGMLVAVLAFPDLMRIVGDLGQSKAVPYALGHKLDEIKPLVGVLMMLWIVSSFTLVLGMFLYYGAGAAEAPIVWIILAAATIPPDLFINYARGVALGLQEMGFFARLFWVRDPIILFGVILAAVLDLPAWSYLVILIISYSIVSALCIGLIAKHTKITLLWDVRRAVVMVGRGFKYAIGGVLMRMNYRFDIIILSLAVFALPKADLTNYSVGVALARMLWQLPIALNQVLFSRSVNSKDPLGFARKAARLMRVAVLFALPMSVGVYFIAPWAIPIVYGKDVDTAGRVTQILLPGIVAFFAARTFEADLTAKGKPWDIVYIMAPVVALNIILNILWIPEQGIFGAAWASTITFILGALLMTIVYARRVHMPLRELITPRVSDFDFPVVRRHLARFSRKRD